MKVGEHLWAAGIAGLGSLIVVDYLGNSFVFVVIKAAVEE